MSDIRPKRALYPAVLNTHHAVKVLALVIMTIDHVGAYLYPDELWWRAVGRITFPVWFFLIGHARDYTIPRDLWLWAVVLGAISPLLGEELFPLNALFTIIACKWLLIRVERRGWRFTMPTICVACAFFAMPTSLLGEYGTQGVLYALMGYAVREGQMGWRVGKLLTLAALVTFIGVQLALLDFTLPQKLFVIVGTTLVTCYLARFSVRPVRLATTHLAGKLVGFLARYSMHYYVIHRVLLQAAGCLKGVLPMGFKLI